MIWTKVAISTKVEINMESTIQTLVEQDQPAYKVADEALSAKPAEATVGIESVKMTVEQDKPIHSGESFKIKKELVARVETVHKEGESAKHVELEKPTHSAEDAREGLVDILYMSQDEVIDAAIEARVTKLFDKITLDAGINWSLLDHLKLRAITVAESSGLEDVADCFGDEAHNQYFDFAEESEKDKATKIFKNLQTQFEGDILEHFDNITLDPTTQNDVIDFLTYARIRGTEYFRKLDQWENHS